MCSSKDFLNLELCLGSHPCKNHLPELPFNSRFGRLHQGSSSSFTGGSRTEILHILSQYITNLLSTHRIFNLYEVRKFFELDKLNKLTMN